MVTKIIWLYLSINIPLSLLIVLIYHFIPNGSLFKYTKLYSSIVENGPFYIELLKSSPTVILLSSHLLGIGFSTLHYWKAHQPSSHSNFDSYLPISHLLGCGLLWFNLVRIWITSYSLTIASRGRGHFIDQVWSTSLLRKKLAFRVNKKLSK